MHAGCPCLDICRSPYERDDSRAGFAEDALGNVLESVYAHSKSFSEVGKIAIDVLFPLGSLRRWLSNPRDGEICEKERDSKVCAKLACEHANFYRHSQPRTLLMISTCGEETSLTLLESRRTAWKRGSPYCGHGDVLPRSGSKDHE